MLLAQNCIYACQSTNQSANILALLACLPDRGYGPKSPSIEKLHDSIDELEMFYTAVELLQKCQVFITIDKLKLLTKREDRKEIDEFLINLCHLASKMCATTSDSRTNKRNFKPFSI
jgi:hypothetical protein